MTEEREGKSRIGGWVVCVVAVFLLVYVLTPGFVIGAFVLIDKKHPIGEGFMVPYIPLVKLAEHFDPYGDFIMWEIEVVAGPIF